MKTTQLTAILLLVASFYVSAQSFNYEITTEGKSPVLLGKINKEGLSSEAYYEWFTKNYDEYQINPVLIDQFKTQLKEYTIKAFMGTWCGDSKREVPRFYKILETADFPLDRLTLIAVSRERDTYKQSPGGEEEGLTIHRVPTFIFYKDGKEVNRIVESPVTTLEADIHAILNGPYTPNYQAVDMVHGLLQHVPLHKFEKKGRKLLPKLKEKATSMYELNTYANVLFFAGKKDEAIAVARLNIKLFPEESRVYSGLANKLFQVEKVSEALTHYEKALELDPENKKLKDKIAEIRGKDAQ